MEVAGTHVLTWAAFVYTTNTKPGLLERLPQRLFWGWQIGLSLWEGARGGKAGDAGLNPQDE